MVRTLCLSGAVSVESCSMVESRKLEFAFYESNLHFSSSDFGSLSVCLSGIQAFDASDNFVKSWCTQNLQKD